MQYFNLLDLQMPPALHNDEPRDLQVADTNDRQLDPVHYSIQLDPAGSQLNFHLFNLSNYFYYFLFLVDLLKIQLKPFLLPGVMQAALHSSGCCWKGLQLVLGAFIRTANMGINTSPGTSMQTPCRKPEPAFQLLLQSITETPWSTDYAFRSTHSVVTSQTQC
jgi:hypothetical protein